MPGAKSSAGELGSLFCEFCPVESSSLEEGSKAFVSTQETVSEQWMCLGKGSNWVQKPSAHKDSSLRIDDSWATDIFSREGGSADFEEEF